jgi:hypothetical protein
MGMAVVFREVKPAFQSILERWLHQSLKQQNETPSIEFGIGQQFAKRHQR